MLVKREPVSFWWVWTKTGSLPKRFHESEEEAAYEAARLARKHPGQKFILLKAYCKYSVRDR